jgi:drug/metabolite transporter (DMT)-like permease
MTLGQLKWFLFVALSIIWGSSFLLMFEGLKLSEFLGNTNAAYAVAGLRMLAGGAVLLPLAIKAFKRIKGKKMWYTIASGYLGSFFPAILFCLAETKLDPSFAGMLNSTTPIFVLLVAISFFGAKIPWQKSLGIIIGLVGSAVLIWAYFAKQLSANPNYNPGNLYYVGFVLLATLFYGINVNMVSKGLSEVSSNDIAAVALTSLIPPAIAILIFCGYFNLDFSNSTVLYATGCSAVLGAVGTSLASILFYVLVKKAGFVFASLVTYGIPFVAVLVSYLKYNDHITWLQTVALGILLGGVYLANANFAKKQQ